MPHQRLPRAEKDAGVARRPLAVAVLRVAIAVVHPDTNDLLRIGYGRQIADVVESLIRGRRLDERLDLRQLTRAQIFRPQEPLQRLFSSAQAASEVNHPTILLGTVA